MDKYLSIATTDFITAIHMSSLSMCGKTSMIEGYLALREGKPIFEGLSGERLPEYMAFNIRHIPIWLWGFIKVFLKSLRLRLIVFLQ